MGFCYQGRKLCCDICMTAGARKVKCPFGYCQATAACPTCRKTRKDVLGREAHVARGCEENHKAFVERENQKRVLLGQGHWLRQAALGVENDNAKVWFVNAGGEEMCVLMPLAVYNFFPLGENVTLRRFELIAGRSFDVVPS